MSSQINTLYVSTRSRTQFIDITSLVEKEITRTKVNQGLCILHVPHTTAAVTINENADPSVREDILSQLNKIVPPNGSYNHREGNSDAHIKASMLGCSLSLIIEQGRAVLGTWQGIFFCEFDGPRRRKVLLKIRRD